MHCQLTRPKQSHSTVVSNWTCHHVFLPINSCTGTMYQVEIRGRAMPKERTRTHAVNFGYLPCNTADALSASSIHCLKKSILERTIYRTTAPVNPLQALWSMIPHLVPPRFQLLIIIFKVRVLLMLRRS